MKAKGEWGDIFKMLKVKAKKHQKILQRKGKFPGAASDKESVCNAGDKTCKFNPWVVKIPWRRAWQTTSVFLPEESHGQRSRTGYSP